MATPATRSGSTGLPRGVDVAPLGSRLLAYVIDHLFPAVVGGTASYLALTLTGSARGTASAVTAVLLLAYAFVVWWMFAVRAAGPGMKVMRLQLVGLSDGRPVGWARFFLRWLVLYVLTLSGIGLIIMLIVMVGQRRRQGWHDLAANSVVIRERVLADPVPAPVAAVTESPLSPAESPITAPPPDELVGVASVDDVATVGPKAATGPAEWQAVLDDGREIDVHGLVLLGRNPTGRGGEEHAELIKIGDDSRTVSKTHLAVGVDDRGLWVMDRGSTNGSTVTAADGESRACPPGDIVAVDPENIVSFGDHWFRVRRTEPTA